MSFKKIYVEITNNCNLNCDFCTKINRQKEFLSLDKFQILLPKLKNYTNYLYFHLMGEPLLHPQINELINIASQSFKINLTTNGYLIDKIKSNPNINQINISLHSFNPRYKITLEQYLENVFISIDELLKNKTIISLRMWTQNPYQKEIIKYINKRYNCQINDNTNKDKIKIKDNLYFEYDTPFIWPNFNNNYYTETGSCQGLRTHIGILVDGTVVPCCLDYDGKLSLGNIYKTSLNEILSSPKAQKMKICFQNNKKIEELCQHCNFYDRIKKPLGSDINEKNTNTK